jgi:hypothetical protein
MVLQMQMQVTPFLRVLCWIYWREGVVEGRTWRRRGREGEGERRKSFFTNSSIHHQCT